MEGMTAVGVRAGRAIHVRTRLTDSYSNPSSAEILTHQMRSPLRARREESQCRIGTLESSTSSGRTTARSVECSKEPHCSFSTRPVQGAVPTVKRPSCISTGTKDSSCSLRKLEPTLILTGTTTSRPTLRFPLNLEQTGSTRRQPRWIVRNGTPSSQNRQAGSLNSPITPQAQKGSSPSSS